MGVIEKIEKVNTFFTSISQHSFSLNFFFFHFLLVLLGPLLLYWLVMSCTLLPRILLVALVPLLCLLGCVFLCIFHPRDSMGYVSGVYFSNWSVYDAHHFPSDLDTAKLSHVFYAFLKIDKQSGCVQLSDPWADTDQNVAGQSGCLGLLHALKKKNRHLKVLMSVGGWGTEATFQHTVSSQTRLDAFIDSVDVLVRKFHFDGVDIDWEYPASAAEGALLCDLLERLRSRLDSIRDGLQLSVAAPAAAEHLQHYDLPRMDRVLTFWNVMCYDFAAAAWSKHTACHLNLYSVNDAMSAHSTVQTYLQHGVPAHKIVLGMPMYGRSFYSKTDPGVGGLFDKDLPYPTDVVDYRDIDADNETYDEERVAAYTFDRAKKLWMSYDNAQGAAAKGAYVREQGLGGGFWWDSKGEALQRPRRLVDAFVGELGGKSLLDGMRNWV